MPNPPSKKHLNSLVEACATLRATEDPDRAGSALATPALPPKAPRATPAPALAAAVLARDHFACRYCGTRVVPGAVLRAAALVWPDALPYDSGWHRESTHPLFTTAGASFDVIGPLALRPATEGADPTDLDAVVTTCWGCNAQKGELSLKRLGWELRKPKGGDWDGLVSSYETLLVNRRDEALSSGERSYHARWLRAFDLDPGVLRQWEGRGVRAA